MSDWSIQPLKNVAHLMSGGTPSKTREEYWNGEIPWLTPKDMRTELGRKTENSVTKLAIGNGTRLAPENALFIVVRGMSLHNEIRIVRSHRAMAFNQDIKAIVPKGIDGRYLYFALGHLRPQLLAAVESAGHGTGRLPTDRLENAPIPIPPLPEQHAIAAILGSIDDRIEANREISTTLEAVARTIFTSWFTDFEPARRHAEGRDPGIAPELGALFPPRLVDTPHGEVPEGWEWQTLSEVSSELRRGISPKYVETDGVQVLNQKCIRDHVVTFDLARRHDATTKPIAGRELRSRDVLVNSTGVGTLGRVGQVWVIDQPTVVDSHITVVRADPKRISPAYLGLNLTGRESEIENLAEGSTGQTELNRARLGRMPILVPSPAVLQKFEEIVAPIFDRTALCRTQSRTLRTLRDLVLPKLISGELRVREAEKLAGNSGI